MIDPTPIDPHELKTVLENMQGVAMDLAVLQESLSDEHDQETVRTAIHLLISVATFIVDNSESAWETDTVSSNKYFYKRWLWRN